VTSPPRDSAGYYGRPIIKPPIWKPLIGWYFLAGGAAGASASLSAAARVRGNAPLGRIATLTAGVAVTACPPLLIADLGRPERFLNMLRVFKPTSPMNVGSWLLTTFGTLQGCAAACEVVGVLPRTRTALQIGAGLLGPAMATYTAVLVSDTAVPVWHGARRELPAVFAAGSAASAGALAVGLGPRGATGPARRLQIAGAVAEEIATRRMERSLGPTGAPYRTGRAGAYASGARAANLAGLVLAVAAGSRRPRLGRASAVVTLAGAALERFAVLAAGQASAADPCHVIEAQRRRRDAGLATTDRG
jgi:formate-dependent nitrite reductase membrane component NrfD